MRTKRAYSILRLPARNTPGVHKLVENNSIQSVPRKKLAKKFNIALVIMYITTVMLTVPVVYWATKKQVYDRAEADLVLLVDVVRSIQDFVATDLRPHFMKEKIFFSPSFSGIVATARIAKYLSEKQPQYYIKNASDNPLNRNNLAYGIELDLLQQFRQSRGSDSITTVGDINGRTYLVSSAPKISKKGCLRCHGNPNKAPADVTETYGQESGYGYLPGQVVGVSLVGVPLADVQTLAVQRSLIIVGAVTLLFALLFLVVNLLVKRLILKPINEITEVATAVSQGDIRRAVLFTQRNDEIADLALAFELMRRSLITAMKRMRRKS